VYISLGARVIGTWGETRQGEAHVQIAKKSWADKLCMWGTECHRRNASSVTVFTVAMEPVKTMSRRLTFSLSGCTKKEHESLGLRLSRPQLPIKLWQQAVATSPENYYTLMMNGVRVLQIAFFHTQASFSVHVSRTVSNYFSWRFLRRGFHFLALVNCSVTKKVPI
jgi:hypothetical protein